MEKLSKEELIKEVQKLILRNDYTIDTALKVADFMKDNMQTAQDWCKEHIKEIKQLGENAIKEAIQREKITDNCLKCGKDLTSAKEMNTCEECQSQENSKQEKKQ